MSKKLLQKSSWWYLFFSIMILLVAAPLFYYVTKRIYIQEADDTLALHQKEFLSYTLPNLTEVDIVTWNKYNRNTRIEADEGLESSGYSYRAYYDSMDAELEPYRELRSPINIQGEKYTYISKVNLVESEDLMKSVGFLFLLIISALLLGLFFITRKLSVSLWKPFYKTLAQIEGFEIDKKNIPVFADTSTEEFTRLNNSITSLIEKNIAIYQSQKEFVENAAHELQTPLAVFKAKIDTLIQHPEITRDQSEILSSLNETASRLNRLNKNLLLLSNIEHGQFGDQENLLLNKIINKNLSFFEEQAEGKEISIKTDLTATSTVKANSVLIEILIRNLFLNAIRHTDPHGEIIVSTSHNEMIFSNSSDGQALNPEKIFQRFSRGHSTEHGTGLGLHIARKIANLHQWIIRYEHDNNFHYFILEF